MKSAAVRRAVKWVGSGAGLTRRPIAGRRPGRRYGGRRRPDEASRREEGRGAVFGLGNRRAEIEETRRGRRVNDARHGTHAFTHTAAPTAQSGRLFQVSSGC